MRWVQHSDKGTMCMDSYIAEEEFSRLAQRKIAAYAAQDSRKTTAFGEFAKGDITPIAIGQLFKKQRGRCGVCGQWLLMEPVAPWCLYQWTLDRIDDHRPHDASNVTLACYRCNSGGYSYQKDCARGCHHHECEQKATTDEPAADTITPELGSEPTYCIDDLVCTQGLRNQTELKGECGRVSALPRSSHGDAKYGVLFENGRHCRVAAANLVVAQLVECLCMSANSTETLRLPRNSTALRNAQPSRIAQLVGIPVLFCKTTKGEPPRRWGNLIAMVMSDPTDCIAEPEWQDVDHSVIVFRTDTWQIGGLRDFLFNLHSYVDNVCADDDVLEFGTCASSFTSELFATFVAKQ